uniref:GDSL esterase/lipase n=1 Tax=Aegilops tauschii subsp. strangulata TaxID=200361 RepID=A0A453EE82_AEGTS
MAISRLSVLVAALACCCLARPAQCGGGGGGQNYTSMFSFGDSLTDTGNLLVSSPLSFNIVGHFPYGMTYFHRPTGRCSDGRLVVDFLAQAFGLPLLQPYLSRGKDVRQGVNFAVGGATAMDPPFFEGIGASDKLWTNLSLSVQLDWFEKLKPLLCSSPKNCKKYFSRSLFLVGEIGGNDYNYAFFKGKTLDDAKSYVPTVSSAIIDATEVRRAAFSCPPLSHQRSSNSAGCMCIGAEADQGRRDAPGGAGEPADGLLVGVPDPAPRQEQGRLRRRRLPENVQRLRAAPQRHGPAEAAGAPAQVPRGPDHVRRLLRRGHGLRQEPQAVRVQAGAAEDVLRRRGAVQLQPQGELRRAGIQRVRRPVGVRQLGRRPPDGGRLPRHRRQHPPRPLH